MWGYIWEPVGVPRLFMFFAILWLFGRLWDMLGRVVEFVQSEIELRQYERLRALEDAEHNANVRTSGRASGDNA
jgi:hypothetical protein